jgi:TIR domain
MAPASVDGGSARRRVAAGQQVAAACDGAPRGAGHRTSSPSTSSDKAFKAQVRSLLTRTKLRLGHYYRLARPYDDDDLQQLVNKCILWHKTIVSERPYTAQYRYDVALSFAGEQRRYAESLAEILRANGVRVFYDSFEQAELWGKNLFDYLYNVYSQDSRYCIVFVSKEYAEKMWTVHERHSAQERVLLDRKSDYLLPIKVDDTKLPGLPATIAYLDLKEGIPSIANLFVRKLGGNVGWFS